MKDQLIAKLAFLFISRISPVLKEEIIAIVKKLEAKAKKTSNPFDDQLVEALKLILDIE